MSHAAHRYASMIEYIARSALAQLDGVSDEALNRSVPLPEANTLFAIATHLAGAGEFWAVTLPGNRPSDRNRSAEFRATGSHADLAARYDRWVADLHTVLDTLPDEALDHIVQPGASHGWLPAGEPLTVRYCLLHAVEHSALHLGHIQLTTQMFENGVW